mmetsp:Transcript_6415/g.10109  ORF Transcript_6415/g.10109 Transcript_6415/m.10109 type:complete len:200 (-) Transcript_6415:480-1079(-)
MLGSNHNRFSLQRVCDHLEQHFALKKYHRGRVIEATPIRIHRANYVDSRHTHEISTHNLSRHAVTPCVYTGFGVVHSLSNRLVTVKSIQSISFKPKLFLQKSKVTGKSRVTVPTTYRDLQLLCNLFRAYLKYLLGNCREYSFKCISRYCETNNFYQVSSHGFCSAGFAEHNRQIRVTSGYFFSVLVGANKFAWFNTKYP